ncbi:MAG: MBL fold metallo-hydrolase [Rhodospirillales bacterium]|nr:MBL fold metallo-hydrolase [Rhodospirillales bacterium]
MQKVATTGNATLVAYDGEPLLATDPWFGDEEPAYFGSWVLSHQIPRQLKDDILACDYVWFSHGHPDHLNPTSVERFKGKKILLADHVGGRIYKDLTPGGFDVTILPDRQWVKLSDNVKIHCITTRIQDSILLVDVGGRLFINLNDAGTRDCSRYIRSITRHYKHSYVLALSGYGDADMINIFREDGTFVVPRAARRPSVDAQLRNLRKATGARSVIPFSSFHQYQREDSLWAQAYTTPVDVFHSGLSPGLECLPPFSSVDCVTGNVETPHHETVIVTPRPATDFGDNWSDQLEPADVRAIETYFARKERIRKHFGFVTFKVGGKEHSIRMDGRMDRGITFEVPRGSLMSAIDYRIFDDLLIGNFMRTTLHGLESLNEPPGEFNYNVAKYGDNGLAETDEEIAKYLAEYRRRAGIDRLVSALEDQSRNFITRFAKQDTPLYRMMKQLYISLR